MENSSETESVNSQVATYLIALRSEIGMLQIDQAKKDEVLKIVNTLDMQFESGRADKTVITDLVGQLPSAAIISTLGSSILKCL